MPTTGLELTVVLHTAAKVTGRVQVAPSIEVPKAVELSFNPVPRRDDLAPAGSVLCPIDDRTWECQVPVGTFDLRLYSPGSIPAYRWKSTVAANSSNSLGTIHLKPGSSLVGQVMKHDGGFPSDRCRVRLSVQGRARAAAVDRRLEALSYETQVNERGYFQIVDIAPGNYVLTAEEPGFAPTSIAPLEIHESLESELVEPLVLSPPANLTLLIGPVATPHGYPWRVVLSRVDPNRVRPVESFQGAASAEGVWEATGIPPGEYRLFLEDDTDSRDLRARWHNEIIEISPGPNSVPVHLDLIRVKGHVSVGEEGVSSTVWLGGKSGARRFRFDSDVNGDFSGVLPEEGFWPVELDSPAEGIRVVLQPVKVEVQRGRTFAKVEIRIPDTRLEGEVVDESNRPVSRAKVLSFSAANSKQPPSQLTSDSEGKFTVRGLPAGPTVLEASEAGRVSDSVTVVLDEGREHPFVRLVLRKTQYFRGRVTSSAGPVPGAQVLAWPSMSSDGGSAGMERVVTGPDGQFSLSIRGGSTLVDVAILAPGYALRILRAQLDSEEPTELLVSRDGGTLILPLLNTAGSKVPMRGLGQAIVLHAGVAVPMQFYSLLARLTGAGVSDSGIILKHLEPGDYTICPAGSAVGPVLRGDRPPGDSCATGYLPPLGQLVLEHPTASQ